MTGFQVRLIDWPIGMMCHEVRVCLQCTPKIAYEPVGVVDRLRPVGFL